MLNRMKKILSVLVIATYAAVLMSCGNNSNNTKEEPSTEDAHLENENSTIVSLTKEQIASIGIQMGKIEEKQLTASLKANGVLQVPNQNKAAINSVYRGVVKSLLVQPGNIVAKGEVIATIANPEFIQTQEEYLNVDSRIVFAEQEYNRQKELNEGNAGALKNLQSAETQLRTLRTRKSALKQQIQLMGVNIESLNEQQLVSVLPVRSPIKGVVSKVGVQIGQYVDISTEVAEIVDNSQLHLDLFVFEKDLSKLKNNQTIHFTLTNNPGKEYDAMIYSLGSSFEGESKAVSVHAKVQGDKTGLIDGMNITAVISLNKATVGALPSDAIVAYQGQDYIFIETGGNTDSVTNAITFERVPVVKGTTDVGYTEVTLLKEIPRDSKVAVKGAFFILAKQTNAGDVEH